MKTRILILCTANSARSQMAEGLLRHDFGHLLEVASAGSRATLVRPEAIQAMADVDIDISQHRSKHVDELAGQTFDYVLTVCDSARETCPIYPGHGKRLHHAFEDPAATEGPQDERLAAFRRVRDQMRTYFQELVPQLTKA